MFLGRERELKLLNNLYEKDNFNFIVMYGRRRVGKTTLLKEFCKDKKSVFFVAEEYNDKLALEKFSRALKESLSDENDKSIFNSWEDAFDYVYHKSKAEKIILVIDEFQYLVNSNKSLLSLIQNTIDHKLKDSNLYLVVCSSTISFMKENVLSQKSPLFGRKTAEFFIKQLGFYNSIKFFKSYSKEDKIFAYAILGGIPLYLLQFNDKVSINDNIKENFLLEISNLFLEPKNLLKMELRSPAVYNSIIESIALGSTKLNEISTKIGEDKDKVYNYILTLMDMHIIEKVHPVTDKKTTRKTIYKLSDNLFKFWYRFIFPNISNIEVGMGDVIFSKKIQPNLYNYVSFIYEDICKEYLVLKNIKGDIPILFDKIGSWWGTNNLTKSEEEIDIMASSEDGLIFGECKFKNEPVGIKEYERLKEKSELFKSENKYYYLFSKSGFKDSLIDYGKEIENLFLVDIDELFKV
jgi:AAA+ ATPase superfamily predicted ATPase